MSHSITFDDCTSLATDRFRSCVTYYASIEREKIDYIERFFILGIYHAGGCQSFYLNESSSMTL